MAPSQRRSQRVITPEGPVHSSSRSLKSFGFEPYAKRETTRNRSFTYIDSDTDSDSSDVIYVGQRKKTRSPPISTRKRASSRLRSRPLASITPPQIILGGEDLSVPVKPLWKKEESVEVERPKPKHQTTPVGVLKTEPSGQPQESQPPTVNHAPHRRPLFQTLPFEVHQNIATYLIEDRDIVKYAKLCRRTRDSISSSVWRERFVRTFDMPLGEIETLVLAKRYAYRREVGGWCCFNYRGTGGQVLGADQKEYQQKNNDLCLGILKELIIESNARKVIHADGKQAVVGLNHDYILEWIRPGARKYTDLLEAVLNTDQTNGDPDDIVSASSEKSLVLIIQLCLSHLLLSRDSCQGTASHFDVSQRQVYADHMKQPVFVGGWKQTINVRWLLYTVNFFKYHLKLQGEGVLEAFYTQLERSQLPQPWTGRIMGGTQPIGSHWKSACTFMGRRPLRALRLHGGNDIDDHEEILDLTIFFDDPKFSSDKWPKAFETLIKSNPYTGTITPPRASRKTRAANVIQPTQYELKTFYGTSRGGESAHFYGRLHGLPDQQGIPGFQRMTFIKFLPLNGEYDPNNVWIYEGCVLPGSRIIVGRWWDLTSDANPIDVLGGPFLWWNVDESTANPPISSEEALEFLDSINDPNMGF